MIKNKIRILDSDQKISRNLLQAAESEIRKIFQQSIFKIKAEIINLIIETLFKTDEVVSLQRGKLKVDFGLPSDLDIEDIIYAVGNSVEIEFKSFKLTKNYLTNILTIYIQRNDFRNILSLPSAYVYTEKNQNLPWLEWLLLKGDDIIISNWTVKYGVSENSRSGGGIMINTGVFKVDSNYSGTIEDNFITRALDKTKDSIVEIVGNNI